MSLTQVNKEIAAAELEADQRETLENGPRVQLLPYTFSTGMVCRASCLPSTQRILKVTAAGMVQCRHWDLQPDSSSEYPERAQATLPP